MEDSKLGGYRIRNAKIPILLSLRRLTDLKPHEETVPSELDRLTKLLGQDPILRHPILADSRTGLVLDGTHRLAALARLARNLVPCALLDYEDSKIVVERWFRTIKGETLDSFRNEVEDLSPRLVSPAEAEHLLSNRSCYASLEDPLKCLVFQSSARDPVDLAHSGFRVEKEARDKGLGIAYTDVKTIPDSDGFGMSTMRMEKREVARCVEQGRLFPPKTTRHIIPSRPMAVNTPLEWLGETNMMLAQQRFLEHLQKRKVTRKPEGSMIGSRRYQEEVFLFE